MANQRRNRVLIGFGAVAIALIAVFVFVSPKFPPENTAGAIGAVQKHHENQISAKDVVLGDEKTRAEQKVLYGDYLADAAKLQNMSGDLGLFVFNRDQVAAKSSLDNMSLELASHQAELANRYMGSMSEALSLSSAYLDANAASFSNKQLESAHAELAAISSALANRQQLGSAQMESLNTMLGHFADTLQMANKSVNAKSSLDNALATLESKSSLDNKALASMSANLELASRQLELGSRGDLVASLASREAYLGAIAMESKALSNAQLELASALASRSSIDNKALDNRAANAEVGSKALDNRAGNAEMANRAANADMANKSLDNRAGNAQMANRAANADMANKSLDNRAGNAEMANRAANADMANKSLDNRAFNSKQLESVSLELANAANQLESKALDNVQLSLASQDARFAELGQMTSTLELCSKQLESRKSSLDNAALANVQKQLSNVSHQLESRNADFQASAAANMQAELAAFSSHLDNREALNNKFALAAKADADMANRMASHARLDNMSALANSLANHAVLASMQNHLSNLSKALDNRALGSVALANRQELASKSLELANRASVLDNKAR